MREDVIHRNGIEGIYSVIEKPDFSVVVPIDGEWIHTVSQNRYPIGKRTIELPQGSLEMNPNANPEEVAAAELKEETGLTSGSMKYVGYQYIATGYSTQRCHIFVAKGLSQGKPAPELEEFDLIHDKMTIANFEQLIKDGAITDATSCNAYLLAKHKGLL